MSTNGYKKGNKHKIIQLESDIIYAQIIYKISIHNYKIMYKLTKNSPNSSPNAPKLPKLSYIHSQLFQVSMP